MADPTHNKQACQDIIEDRSNNKTVVTPNLRKNKTTIYSDAYDKNNAPHDQITTMNQASENLDSYGKASEKTRSRYVNQLKPTGCFQCLGESSRIAFFCPTRPKLFSKFLFFVYIFHFSCIIFNFLSVSKTSEYDVFSEDYFVLFEYV